KRALILDIGGGSAEIIASDHGRMVEGYSKPLGAVRLREAFLMEDPPSARQLHQLRTYIQGKLDPPARRLGHMGWDRVIATSATAAAVVRAITRTPRTRREDIDQMRVTTPQIRKLYSKLSESSLAARRKVTGIGPKRAEIIVPGIAVML